ncbi:PREDICTED: uncharacterized protein LOC104799985 [Tarenaya hassleriana]|uniref:uncharacterized protein LOC104799985 n=1 Tax=Tarenaya hassleriana TaxID=28532 RepID=UPI00053CA647|nr:PREDICTED: uncharacterized protein LOC104799985 [Tarenaya hassleriana]
MCGGPLYLYPLTESKSVFNFAKVYFEISMTKSPPRQIAITLLGEEERYINVAYEWLPPICDHCSEIGHTTKYCPLPTGLTGENPTVQGKQQWQKKSSPVIKDPEPIEKAQLSQLPDQTQKLPAETLPCIAKRSDEVAENTTISADAVSSGSLVQEPDVNDTPQRTQGSNEDAKTSNKGRPTPEPTGTSDKITTKSGQECAIIENT